MQGRAIARCLKSGNTFLGGLYSPQSMNVMQFEELTVIRKTCDMGAGPTNSGVIATVDAHSSGRLLKVGPLVHFNQLFLRCM